MGPTLKNKTLISDIRHLAFLIRYRMIFGQNNLLFQCRIRSDIDIWTHSDIGQNQYRNNPISIWVWHVFSIYMLPFQYILYIRKTKTANFRLFFANRKRKFVFLGRQTINGNRRLLFQQTCPSMHWYYSIGPVSVQGNLDSPQSTEKKAR